METGDIVRVEFAAQVRVGEGRAVCTDNVVTLDDDGTFLLHMVLAGEGGPVLDLAIPPTAPVGILTAVVTAMVTAAGATTDRSESSPAP